MAETCQDCARPRAGEAQWSEFENNHRDCHDDLCGADYCWNTN